LAKRKKKSGTDPNQTHRPGAPIGGSPDDQINSSTDEDIDAPDIYKGDINGFVGELPINLDREMKEGGNLRDELSLNLAKWLQQELDNQSRLVDKLAIWDKQYSGKKREKAYPYLGVNNCAIPETRIVTDAIVVRIFDNAWGQKKLFICEARKADYIDTAKQLEDALDWWQKDVAHLKDKLFSPTMQAIKTGTSFVKLSYVQRNRTNYRYASPAEVSQKDPGLFKFKNGQYGIKKVMTHYNGPDVMPISREDFVYSSDATNLDDCLFCGHRVYLRKPEIKARVLQGLYDGKAYDEISAPDQIDQTKISRADSKGIEVKSEEKDKYEVWELWLRYDVDEDGEEDDIVVTFHLKTKTILRAIYNPLFYGFRPFVALRYAPREFSIEGEGTCEILEKLQEELDNLHNARLDKLDQINAPMVLVREGSGLEQDFRLAPGLVKVTSDDLENCVKFLEFPDVYTSTFTEEKIITDYMQQALGIGPSALGLPTAERPVARETYQLQQEMNKKFKFGNDNMRDRFGEIGMKAAMMMAQYQPKYTYYTAGDKGAMQEQTMDFPFEFLRDAVGIELMASSELQNTETRRENNLIAYQMLSDYDTKLAGMVQTILNPMVPPDFKKFLMDVAIQGGRLLREFLDDMGKRDSDTLVPDIGKSVDLMKALQPPPPPQMPPPGMGQGGPPGPGGPPQGGPPPHGGGPQGPPGRPPQQGMPPMGAPRPPQGPPPGMNPPPMQ